MKTIPDNSRLIGILKKFSGKRILVIGDIMLDKYIWGDVSRISPEAPVQVVNVLRETYAPGGAANVANNAAALGSFVYIAGITGKDEPRTSLIEELKKRGISTDGVFADSTRPTIQKIRVIAKSQQLLRVDYEIKEYYPESIEKSIIDFAGSKIAECDAVIISDYAKGVVTKGLATGVIRICNEKNKPVVIDPKPRHSKFYVNSTLITPNHYEAGEMIDMEITDEGSVSEIGFKLAASLNTNVLITRGEKGMSLFQKGRKAVDIPTKAKEVYNIIGAGDTVAAAVALALASGASLEDAAFLGNVAAGIKVGKIEDPTVSIEEIKKELIS